MKLNLKVQQTVLHNCTHTCICTSFIHLVLGRKIRVDWVLPREKYQSQKETKELEEVKMETDETQQKEEEGEEGESLNEEEEELEGEDEGEEEGEEEVEEEGEEEEEEDPMDEDVPVPKHVNDVKEGRTLFIR